MEPTTVDKLTKEGDESMDTPCLTNNAKLKIEKKENDKKKQEEVTITQTIIHLNSLQVTIYGKIYAQRYDFRLTAAR